MTTDKPTTKREKKWFGTWPANCDGCEVDLSTVSEFYDARSKFRGSWGLWCPQCFYNLCGKLGVGYGQKYDSKTLVKLEG